MLVWQGRPWWHSWLVGFSQYPEKTRHLVTALSVLWFTASDYSFYILKHLAIIFTCPSIDGFWLPLWYLQAFGHYICPSFDFASDNLFGIFKPFAIALSVLQFTDLISSLVSWNFWLYCLSFDWRILISRLVSSNVWPW